MLTREQILKEVRNFIFICILFLEGIIIVHTLYEVPEL
jgi:hypothetical protein